MLTVWVRSRIQRIFASRLPTVYSTSTLEQKLSHVDLRRDVSRSGHFPNGWSTSQGQRAHSVNKFHRAYLEGPKFRFFLMSHSIVRQDHLGVPSTFGPISSIHMNLKRKRWQPFLWQLQISSETLPIVWVESPSCLHARWPWDLYDFPSCRWRMSS